MVNLAGINPLARDDEKWEVQNNAHSLHTNAEQPKQQAQSAFWRALGLAERGKPEEV